MPPMHVEHAHLGRASDRFDDLGQDTRLANDYVDTHPGSLQQWDGRLFALSLGGHDGTVQRANHNVDRSRTLLTGVARNLATAEQRYRDSEDDATVNVLDLFDALGGGGTGPGTGASAPGSTSFGAAVPSEQLTPPRDLEGIPEWAQLVIGLGGDLLSPTYALGVILNMTIGRNPLDWFVEQFAGDWQGTSRTGDAFTHLGEYYREFGALVGSDAEALFAGWEGDGAEAARPYFDALAEAFTGLAAPLEELGREYVQLAYGMHFTMQSIKSLVSMLIDIALIAALNWLIVTATGWFNPGAAVSAAILLACIGMILKTWMTILQIHGYAMAAAYGFAGLTAGFLTHPGVDQLTIPGEA